MPGLFYNNGPIQAGATYSRHDKFRCYNAAGTHKRRAEARRTAGFAATDDAFTIAGSYDFGVARVALMYEHLKYETPTGDLKRDMWGISSTIPMGGGYWYLYYGRAGDGKGGASDSESRINSLVHGSDSASSNFEIAYRYDLSKRTSVNVGYVMIRNDRARDLLVQRQRVCGCPWRRPERLRAGFHPQFLIGLQQRLFSVTGFKVITRASSGRPFFFRAGRDMLLRKPTVRPAPYA